MNNRIALFASGDDIESFFGIEVKSEIMILPDYNIAPGKDITILPERAGGTELIRLHWGLSEENREAEKDTVSMNEALRGLKEGLFKRCIIPVSGYYKWKDDGKRAEFPFFIRMLDEPVMALAGVMNSESENSDGRQLGCAIIETESNALIQPLDPGMPLQMSKELSRDWLDSNVDFRHVIEEAQKLFWMTQMTVLRVSNKVNDLSVNNPNLIQPLPK